MRLVVPQDLVTEDIDPPEYRFEYYSKTIRRLPSLFAKSPTQVVIIDETFHMRSFRQMWDETCMEGPYQVVDTGKEIIPQVEKILMNISCKRC